MHPVKPNRKCQYKTQPVWSNYFLFGPTFWKLDVFKPTINPIKYVNRFKLFFRHRPARVLFKWKNNSCIHFIGLSVFFKFISTLPFMQNGLIPLFDWQIRPSRAKVIDRLQPVRNCNRCSLNHFNTSGTKNCNVRTWLCAIQQR